MYDREREAKRTTPSDIAPHQRREAARNEIERRLLSGESVIRVMHDVGWNAVAKATHRPKRSGARGRRAEVPD